MTCIAGVVHRGAVFIGGDSAGIAGWELTVRKDRKVFTSGPYAFGFTTSFRMGQLLRYKFKPPERPRGVDLMEFMATTFIDAIRHTLKDGGFATKKDDAELGGCFLVGHSGRLFRIESDYQVGETVHGFDAVGCGEPYALGHLNATRDQSPRRRLLHSLKTAERFSAGVRGPFHVVSIGEG